MPITSVSCVLCGAPVEDIFHSVTWLQKFRVVYTILQNWNEARLSGIGERRQFEDVIPLDDSVDEGLPGINYEEPEIGIRLMVTKFGGRYPPNPPLVPQPAWGFPFHTSCLEILSVACPEYGSCLDLQAIFDLCRSQPYKHGPLDWGHDYEGLIGPPKDVDLFCPGEELDLALANLKTDVYTHDPLNIPQLRHLFTDSINLHVRNDASVTNETPAIYHTGGDPLNGLPTEILHMILIWMDSRDVANLRLASPVYASLVLPDRFWLSRFWEGREFEYVFEANMIRSAGRDWRQLFQRVKLLASLPSMANRRRVWSLARHLCGLINRRRSYNSCNGEKISTLFEPDGIPDSGRWVTAGPTLYAPTEQYRSGARSLYERRVTLEATSKSIYVSTVKIKNKRYVSGIRIVYNNDQSALFGYCNADDGANVTWGEHQQPITLIGFHVAFDSKGIRGIRILSSVAGLSYWIGDWYELSQRILVLPTHLPPQYLKGGFDALKLVSLSISDGEDTSPPSPSTLHHQHSSLRETAIWHGEIPHKELSFLGPHNTLLKDYRDSLPFSLLIFGGVDGTQLPYLIRITVWVVDNTELGLYADRTHIWGIEFSFSRPIDGKSSILLGQIPDERLPNSEIYHMDLESGLDERITGLEAFYEDPTYVFGLKFYTNRGRAIEFPPSCTDQLPSDEYFSDILKPEDGTIVGVYAVLKHNDVFRSIGVAYIPYD
ncbi:hypothetical protein F5Y00DRAFT_271566 [Daldinia vernicosa]|uniref:uncharacterized protein n=1 Tax=Daldinia vernicosa TaxID=114800 RepID=UPI00200779CB|nr:uncharacterized protein F5Y00DRAFT_271566 [Daldinia vernicosa]KAI0853022.1 hypothetical protein F5Y00DRAFT_271566 [Daldinia vernicosa]